MLLVLDMRQATGSRTVSHAIGHLEICMSANSQVMLDQVLERAHMTWLNGWSFLSIDIDERNAAIMFLSVPIHLSFSRGYLPHTWLFLQSRTIKGML